MFDPIKKSEDSGNHYLKVSFILGIVSVILLVIVDRYDSIQRERYGDEIFGYIPGVWEYMFGIAGFFGLIMSMAIFIYSLFLSVKEN
jgi:hypothetical protein